MQYTGPVPRAPMPPAPLEVPLDDLAQAFASVSNPRRGQGRVYWLPSLLCLAVAALL